MSKAELDQKRKELVEQLEKIIGEKNQLNHKIEWNKTHAEVISNHFKKLFHDIRESLAAVANLSEEEQIENQRKAEEIRDQLKLWFLPILKAFPESEVSADTEEEKSILEIIDQQGKLILEDIAKEHLNADGKIIFAINECDDKKNEVLTELTEINIKLLKLQQEEQAKIQNEQTDDSEEAFGLS